MPVYKDKQRGTWYVSIRYRDWTGENKIKKKRGFMTQKEAKEYEQEFVLRNQNQLDMSFKSFVEVYMKDMRLRLKTNTCETKENIINTHILPYFEKKKINEITVADVIEWQNKMTKFENEYGEGYSQTYLKTIHNQLSAIFNYACRFYGLRDNPARKAGRMGKEKTGEMKFWTKEEYIRFSRSMMLKDDYFHAFEMLYWCGLRLGEMLALTPADFDFEKGTVWVNKSYQSIKGEDYITDPKTPKSNRVIQMPDFLSEEIQQYIKRLYMVKPTDRIFTMSKSGMHHEMDRGCKETGVKRIRIHDLRHSHVSLLIEMGFNAVEIASRVGHESIDITYRYAHMFPSKDREIASKLNDFRGGMFDVKKEL